MRGNIKAAERFAPASRCPYHPNKKPRFMLRAVKCSKHLSQGYLSPVVFCKFCHAAERGMAYKAGASARWEAKLAALRAHIGGEIPPHIMEEIFLHQSELTYQLSFTQLVKLWTWFNKRRGSGAGAASLPRPAHES